MPNCAVSALPCTYAYVAFAGPMVNYRSIGTNAANLYATGTATLPLGSTTVAFTGCLPASVGIGDALTFTSGSAETLYVLSRDDANTVTVQTAAAFNHAAGSTFTIKRAFNTLAAWETAQGGNLVTMQWWDDIWLNEAFAQWMAFRVIAELSPEYHLWDHFQAPQNYVFGVDALDTTHPIYTPVQTPAPLERDAAAGRSTLFSIGRAKAIR